MFLGQLFPVASTGISSYLSKLIPVAGVPKSSLKGRRKTRFEPAYNVFKECFPGVSFILISWSILFTWKGSGGSMLHIKRNIHQFYKYCMPQKTHYL